VVYKKWNTEEERKAARLAAQARYRKKNLERIRALARVAVLKRYYADHEGSKYRRRERYRLLREEVLSAYGGACTCCGETTLQFLALDHINGTTTEQRAKDRKSGFGWYAKLRREGYPNHIQIHCHNCNAAKGFYGVCPHQA